MLRLYLEWRRSFRPESQHVFSATARSLRKSARSRRSRQRLRKCGVAESRVRRCPAIIVAGRSGEDCGCTLSRQGMRSGHRMRVKSGGGNHRQATIRCVRVEGRNAGRSFGWTPTGISPCRGVGDRRSARSSQATLAIPHRCRHQEACWYCAGGSGASSAAR